MKIVLCALGAEVESAVSSSLLWKGHEVLTFSKVVNDKDYDLDYLNCLMKYIHENKAEMVWCMDYLPIIARACNTEKIFYISWVLREQWNTLYSDTFKYPINFIFIGDKTIVDQFYPDNPGHIFYLPPATIVNDVEVIPDTVSISSKISINPNYYIKNDYSDYLKGYIRGMVEAQQRVYGYDFIPKLLTQKIMVEFDRILGSEERGKDYNKVPLNILINNYICDIITQKDYTEIENYLKGLGIYYEGNNICAINVNITDRKWKSGISYDMLRTMGAGGFVLTNYQKDLELFFELGYEVVVYEDHKDLQEKINYYLVHSQERIEIASRGKKKIEESFSVYHRIEDIFYCLING